MDNRIHNIQPLTTPSQPPDGSKRGLKESFKEILREEIKFSAHATKRLESRNIRLSPQDQEKLVDAVSKAAEKGAREALVLLKDLAFVVSVKNRVVITAMNAEEGVFTNIDSAVIAGRTSS